MSRAVFRKMWANLRSRWFQTTLIFLILVIAAVTSSLALSIRSSTSQVWQRTFDATNGAHMWFIARSEEGDLTPLKSLPAVTASTDAYPVARGFSLSKDNDKYELLILGYPAELPAISKPQLTSGRWLETGKSNEVVLDRSLARNLNINVGEQIAIPTSLGNQSFDVVGLAVNTIQGPYPSWSPGLIYVLPETIPLIAPDADSERRSTMLGVQLKDPQAIDAFTKSAIEALPPQTIGASIDWIHVQDVVGFSNDLTTSFLTVFSIFALVAVAFIITNTISGTVLAQYREIGLLKAIGWKPSQVTGMFLVEYLFIGLLASIVGIVISLFLVPLFLAQVAELLNTTAQTSLDPSLFVIVPLAVLGAVTLASLIPAWRGGRIGTIEAITVGYERTPRRPSLLGRIFSKLGFSPVAVLGVKDAFSRPLRATLTVISLTLTIMTVVFTLNMESSIQKYEQNPALLGLHYDLFAARGFVSNDEAQRIFNENQDVSAFYGMRFVSTKAADSSVTRQIQTRALSGDLAKFDIVQEGRMFSAPGEAIVGQGLLDMLNLKIGDPLKLKVEDQDLNLTIVGRYVEPDNGGRMAMYSLDTLNEQVGGETREPNLYALKLVDGADKAAVKNALLAASDDQMRVQAVSSSLTSDAADLRMIMWGFSIILLLIGLVNLFNTTSLGVRERQRDFGSFKTIGLTPGQIVRSVAVGMLFLAFLAVVLGIPLGIGVTGVLFDYIGSTIGFGTISAAYNWLWMLVLIPLAVAVTLIASVFPARRAANVQIAEAIRYE